MKLVASQCLLAVQAFLLFAGSPLQLGTEAQTLSTVSEQYFNIGDNVTFGWVASPGNFTIGTINWRKDSTLVAQLLGILFPGTGYRGRVTQIGNAGIRLSNVTENDAGTYECSVAFTGGPTVVTSSQLTKAEPASLVIMTVQWVFNVVNGTSGSFHLEKGENVTYTCDSIGGKPPPTYTFQTPDGTTTSNPLIISSFKDDHVGNYSCIASNVAGDVPSTWAVFNIKIVSDSGTITITIVCSVVGGCIIIIGGVIICWYWWKKKSGEMAVPDLSKPPATVNDHPAASESAEEAV